RRRRRGPRARGVRHVAGVLRGSLRGPAPCGPGVLVGPAAVARRGESRRRGALRSRAVARRPPRGVLVARWRADPEHRRRAARAAAPSRGGRLLGSGGTPRGEVLSSHRRVHRGRPSCGARALTPRPNAPAGPAIRDLHAPARAAPTARAASTASTGSNLLGNTHRNHYGMSHPRACTGPNLGAEDHDWYRKPDPHVAARHFCCPLRGLERYGPSPTMRLTSAILTMMHSANTAE